MTRRNRLFGRLQIDLMTLAQVADRGDWEAVARVQKAIATTLAALRNEDAPDSPLGGEIVTGPWKGWRP